MEKNETKGALSANDKIFSIIIHDLKTPLFGITGISELLFQEMNKPEYRDLCEKYRTFLNILKSSCNNILEVIKNLDTWTRQLNGSLTYRPVNINLAELINTNVELLKVFAKNKEIQLISCINNNPEGFADFEMLNIVIRNLISNALKFTNKGGKVEITCNTEKNSIILCVADNGTGISRELLKCLFDNNSFIQTPGTEKEKGTGLGLKFCKELIEMNNGKIWVKSEQGFGSSFYISIPKK